MSTEQIYETMDNILLYTQSNTKIVFRRPVNIKKVTVFNLIEMQANVDLIF